MGNIESKLQLGGIINGHEAVKVMRMTSIDSDGFLGIVQEKYTGGTLGCKQRAGVGSS